MIEFDAKVKQWGNSMGIIIPKEVIKSQKLKPNKTIRVMLPPKDDTMNSLWGLLGRKVSEEEGKRMTADFMKQRQEERDIEWERMERFSSSTPTRK